VIRLSCYQYYLRVAYIHNLIFFYYRPSEETKIKYKEKFDIKIPCYSSALAARVETEIYDSTRSTGNIAFAIFKLAQAGFTEVKPGKYNMNSHFSTKGLNGLLRREQNGNGDKLLSDLKKLEF